MRNFLFAIAMLGLLNAEFSTHSIATAQTQPNRVDLSKRQTSLKEQGDRGTCSAYATVAALEAAYKRAGYGDLDLSEEFVYYTSKMFELPEQNPTRTAAQNLIGAKDDGGISNLLLFMMEDGLGVPAESAMPYRKSGYADAGPDDHPYWKDQFNVNSFNLRPRNLPMTAITAPLYYRAKSCQIIPEKVLSQAETYEHILESGREIIITVSLSGNTSGRIWRWDGEPKPKDGLHVMLMVGYDRAGKYFIVKNSWDKSRYTFISYDYLRYMDAAVYITAVHPPKAWSEIGLVGRWWVETPGLRGVLDVYHIPGIAQGFFDALKIKDDRGQILQDRRIGTFYPEGNAKQGYRVNGLMKSGTMKIAIDTKLPASNVDSLNGQTFTFSLHSQNSNWLIAGSKLAGRRITSDSAFGGTAKPCQWNKLPEVIALRDAISR